MLATLAIGAALVLINGLALYFVLSTLVDIFR
jgi:hypothetical protein